METTPKPDGWTPAVATDVPNGDGHAPAGGGEHGDSLVPEPTNGPARENEPPASSSQPSDSTMRINLFLHTTDSSTSTHVISGSLGSAHAQRDPNGHSGHRTAMTIDLDKEVVEEMTVGALKRLVRDRLSADCPQALEALRRGQGRDVVFACRFGDNAWLLNDDSNNNNNNNNASEGAAKMPPSSSLPSEVHALVSATERSVSRDVSSSRRPDATPTTPNSSRGRISRFGISMRPPPPDIREIPESALAHLADYDDVKGGTRFSKAFRMMDGSWQLYEAVVVKPGKRNTKRGWAVYYSDETWELLSPSQIKTCMLANAKAAAARPRVTELRFADTLRDPGRQRGAGSATRRTRDADPNGSGKPASGGSRSSRVSREGDAADSPADVGVVTKIGPSGWISVKIDESKDTHSFRKHQIEPLEDPDGPLRTGTRVRVLHWTALTAAQQYAGCVGTIVEQRSSHWFTVKVEDENENGARGRHRMSRQLHAQSLQIIDERGNPIESNSTAPPDLKIGTRVRVIDAEDADAPEVPATSPVARPPRRTMTMPKTCHMCNNDLTSGGESELLPCRHVMHLDCLNLHLQRPARVSRKRSNGLVDCPICRTYFIPQKRHLYIREDGSAAVSPVSLYMDLDYFITERARPGGPSQIYDGTTIEFATRE